MAALAILTTGLLAVLLVRNETLKMTAEAENLLQAVQLAEQRLAEFEVSGYPDNESSGSFTEHPSYQWQVKVAPVSLAMKATVYRVDLVITYPTMSGADGRLLVTTCFAR